MIILLLGHHDGCLVCNTVGVEVLVLRQSHILIQMLMGLRKAEVPSLSYRYGVGYEVLIHLESVRLSLLVVVSTIQANLRLFCKDSLRRSGEKRVHLWLLDLGVICGLCCGLLGCHWLDYLSVDGHDLLLFAVTLFQIFIILVMGHVKLH